jgi:hypothetical protein
MERTLRVAVALVVSLVLFSLLATSSLAGGPVTVKAYSKADYTTGIGSVKCFEATIAVPGGQVLNATKIDSPPWAIIGCNVEFQGVPSETWVTITIKAHRGVGGDDLIGSNVIVGSKQVYVQPVWNFPVGFPWYGYDAGEIPMHP